MFATVAVTGLVFPRWAHTGIMICLANSGIQDQLASSEASWLGSSLFVIDIGEKLWFQSNQLLPLESDFLTLTTTAWERWRKCKRFDSVNNSNLTHCKKRCSSTLLETKFINLSFAWHPTVKNHLKWINTQGKPCSDCMNAQADLAHCYLFLRNCFQSYLTLLCKWMICRNLLNYISLCSC